MAWRQPEYIKDSRGTLCIPRLACRRWGPTRVRRVSLSARRPPDTRARAEEGGGLGSE